MKKRNVLKTIGVFWLKLPIKTGSKTNLRNRNFVKREKICRWSRPSMTGGVKISQYLGRDSWIHSDSQGVKQWNGTAALRALGQRPVVDISILIRGENRLVLRKAKQICWLIALTKTWKIWRSLILRRVPKRGQKQLAGDQMHTHQESQQLSQVSKWYIIIMDQIQMKWWTNSNIIKILNLLIISNRISICNKISIKLKRIWFSNIKWLCHNSNSSSS